LVGRFGGTAADSQAEAIALLVVADVRDQARRLILDRIGDTTDVAFGRT